MRLEDIGFYTLSDERARNASSVSPLWRCELLLTDRCNFRCPYCRGLQKPLQGDISRIDAQNTIDLWAGAGLKHVRFSGGEPTLWNGLVGLVEYAKSLGVKRIALSTNGSAPLRIYRNLIRAGVDDISVSLDACCATVGEAMCGGIRGAWDRVVGTLRAVAQMTYVTVGVVVNDQNLAGVAETIALADSLGVADIRIIPSAQYGPTIPGLCSLDQEIIERHPILRYRLNNLLAGRPFRGLSANDSKSCYLVRDDMAVCGGYHFPCIIYLREGGAPIGKVGPFMREEREAWYANHDTHRDPICKNNCLDVCVDYNNRVEESVLRPRRLNPSLFDWQGWRIGTPLDLGLFCRTESLCSEGGKKILREAMLGYCPGDRLPVRAKNNTVAVLVKMGDDQFWFHITKAEFVEIFPELA